MVNSLLNAASFDCKFMPLDVPRRPRSKRVAFDPVCRYEEKEDKHDDHYYIRMLLELQDQETKFFAYKDKLSAELKRKPLRSAMEKDDNMKMKKKKATTQKQVVRAPVLSNEATDRLKEFITQEIKGSDIKLVIQKTLFVTDLTKSQNRLSMPINQLETHEFLRADERRDLEKGKEFAVPLLGPKLRVHEKPMVLKMWHMKNSNNYVLKTNWYRFVEENEEDLKEKTKIQVWSYRKDEDLCFAVACVERPEVQNFAA